MSDPIGKDPRTYGAADANAMIAATPLPSEREIAQRSRLLYQAVRFVVLNLKIVKLSRQHH